MHLTDWRFYWKLDVAQRAILMFNSTWSSDSAWQQIDRRARYIYMYVVCMWTKRLKRQQYWIYKNWLCCELCICKEINDNRIRNAKLKLKEGVSLQHLQLLFLLFWWRKWASLEFDNRIFFLLFRLRITELLIILLNKWTSNSEKVHFEHIRSTRRSEVTGL